MSDKSDYIIEWARTAREELLLRVKHRDSWLKLQLLVQAIIWGIAYNIKIGQIGFEKAYPDILVLSTPIALVFTALYYVEDGLIYHLSKYIGSLSDITADADTKTPLILNWDSSTQLGEYAKKITLVLRLVAQLAAFVVLPLYLSYANFSNSSFWIVLVQIVLSLLIIGIVILGYIQRRKTGGKKT